MDAPDVEFYMNQQYPVILRQLSAEEGGRWFAEIKELPGCMADGETPQEALDEIQHSKRQWITTTLKRGVPVSLPDAAEEDDYSGRITLRMPKSLHRKVAEQARKEGMSLNQFLLAALAFESGVFEADAKAPREIRVVIDRESDERLGSANRLYADTLGLWNSMYKTPVYLRDRGVSSSDWEEVGFENWADAVRDLGRQGYR